MKWIEPSGVLCDERIGIRMKNKLYKPVARSAIMGSRYINKTREEL